MKRPDPIPLLEKDNEGRWQENELRWEGLFRGTSLGFIMNRQLQYIGFIDRRANVIITLSTLLIPFAVSQLQTEFRTAGLIIIATALVSLFTAIWSLFPHKQKPHADKNLMHFGDISTLSEDEYAEVMRTTFTHPDIITPVVVRDIHRTATDILLPKIFALKISYFCFAAGSLLAVASVLLGW